MTRGQARFRTADGIALVVTSVVGAGIFTVPAYVASLAGSSWLILALWAAGGLMAMAGALCYAELAARCPRGGAEYVYLREAFGDTVGFLSGWTSFIAGFSGAIAAAAVGFAAHLADALPSGFLGSYLRVTIGPLTAAVSTRSLVALGLIGVCTGISIGGVRMGRIATNALTLCIVGGILLLACAGMFRPAGLATPAAGVVTLGAASALVPIFFTYSGWNAAAYVAAEYRNPSRDVPRALIGGTLVVTLLYVGINYVMLDVVPISGMASSYAPLAAMGRALLGSTGSTVVTMLALTALASSVCAMAITGPRIYVEMAADGALPAAFAAKGSVPPPIAVIAQSLWSGVLVLTGTFEQIVTYTGSAIVLFSGGAVCALFVLRHRHGRPRTFAVPGYPIVPLAFIACAFLISAASFRYQPLPSLLGVALIAAGVPFRRVSHAVAVSRTA